MGSEMCIRDSDSIKRGGGGGAGCLGISFNVITGEEIPGIREGKRAIYGARRTLNVTQYREHPGDSYNPVTMRDVPATAPPHQTTEMLKRSEDVHLRTRPW